jgi:hypothetical protein
MLIHGLTRGDRDVVTVNAFAYGVSRLAGILAAARPDAPLAPALPPPAPHAAAFPSFPRAALGVSYGFSF